MKKTITGIVVAGCIVAIGLSRTTKSGKPERAFQFDFSAPTGKIFNGRIYWAAELNPNTATTVQRPNQRDTRILSRSVSGEPERAAAVYGPDFSMFDNDMLTVSSAGVCYGVVPKKQRQGPIASENISASIIASPRRPSKYLGVFASPAILAGHPRVPDEKRTSRTNRVATAEIHVYGVRAAGGADHPLCTLTVDEGSALLVGTHAFWTRTKPYTETTVGRANTYWHEIPQCSDLMWTDLETGVVRRLRSMSYAWRSAGKSGVIYAQVRPYPDTDLDMFYVRASDGAVFNIGRGDGSAGWSVELNGSLYWFSFGRDLQPQRLMAIDLNGSASQRNILTMVPPDRYSLGGKNIFVWRNRLYCLVSHATGTQATQGVTWLARLNPGRKDPLEIIQSLPAVLRQVDMDGGYVYYVIRAPASGLFAGLTGDAASGPIRDTLYSVRLPD